MGNDEPETPDPSTAPEPLDIDVSTVIDNIEENNVEPEVIESPEIFEATEDILQENIDATVANSAMHENVDNDYCVGHTHPPFNDWYENGSW